MKAVVQRVSQASVTVNGTITGSIYNGLLVLLAIHKDDTPEQLVWMADKLLRLRIFRDEEDKMNRSVQDVNGGILVVSQFTLYGDVRKGTRPSFIESAPPEKAESMYNDFVNYLKKHSTLRIETGIFGAMMDVQLTNDGPVTIILER